MNTKLRRARLSLANRLREKIWIRINRQMDHYAEKLGTFYDGTPRNKLTGSHHVERVVLDPNRSLQMAMPHATLKSGKRRNKHVADARLYKQYCEAMFAAGVDVTLEFGCALISPRHAAAALAIFRFSETVHLPEYADNSREVRDMINQVKRIQATRKRRWDELIKAEITQHAPRNT